MTALPARIARPAADQWGVLSDAELRASCA